MGCFLNVQKCRVCYLKWFKRYQLLKMSSSTSLHLSQANVQFNSVRKHEGKKTSFFFHQFIYIFWSSHIFMSMSKLCFLLSCNWLMCIVNTITNNISSSTENKPKRDSLLELKVPYCNHVNLILFANNKYDLYLLFKTPVNQFWCLRSRFRAMFAASRKKRLNLILILYFFNICFVNDCQLTAN